MKWKYLNVTFAQDGLNKLGEDGWEAYATQVIRGVLWTFLRRVKP